MQAESRNLDALCSQFPQMIEGIQMDIVKTEQEQTRHGKQSRPHSPNFLRNK